MEKASIHLKPQVAIAPEATLAQIVSEQLDGTVQDVVLLHQRAAHRMYAACWDQPDGLTPIVIRFFLGSRGDEEARIESNALRGLYRAGYPVPEVYLTIADARLAGAPFLVMEHIPGQPLGKVALADRARIPYWLDQASNLLLKLHGLKWQNSFDTFQPALSALDFAERQIKWWSRQAEVVGAEEASAGFHWLKTNLYLARRTKSPALIHRDFHPNNVLVDGDRIAGVVDWGELTIADPAVDVAWTEMILHTEVSRDLGDQFKEAYRRRNPEIDQSLPFWEVFAACKRLTIMARIQQATTETPDEVSTPPVRLEVARAVVDFMQERLTEED